MLYPEFLTLLKSCSDENYAAFHKKLLKNDKIYVIGVKVPDLRKIAKDCTENLDELFSFPDEYYEVTFVKLTAVSLLDFDKMITYIDRCVSLIDNWATCDCFTPKCILKHREDFLPYIEKYANRNNEFSQRFALTSLLHFYMDELYAEIIFGYTETVNTSFFYVHMAVAWLIAESLVKFYDKTVEFLLRNTLDKKTHNKSIQKACESYRLSAEQKNFLKGMKR